MASLAELNNWEEAFIKYSVPELRTLNGQLTELAYSKKTELRDLVGNRYRDMLKTADIIISMNDVVTKEDNALSDLTTNSKYTSWDSHESNFSTFHTTLFPGIFSSGKKVLFKQHKVDIRQAYLQGLAVSHLLKSIIPFIRRHLNDKKLYDYGSVQPHNFLIISRSLRLARLLLSHGQNYFDTTNQGHKLLAKYTSEVDTLSKQFEDIITSLLLNGEANDLLPSSSYNSLFLAYAHFNGSTPMNVLEKLLDSRLKFIKEQLDLVVEYLESHKDDKEKEEAFFDNSFLPSILSLVSTTFRIANKAFSKNHVAQYIQKQADAYSLLDTPGITDDFELKVSKYRKWLPLQIQEERAFPEDCIATSSFGNTTRLSTKTLQHLKSQLQSFSNSIVDLFDEKFPQIISLIPNLYSLVTVYRQILEVARDNSSVRNLTKRASKGEEKANKSLYKDVFIPSWTKKLNLVVESSIKTLLSQENALRAIHKKIVESDDKIENTAAQDNIFSVEFSKNLSSSKGYNYASSLFEALDDFCVGSVGYIKPVSHEYKAWLNLISEIRNNLVQFGNLKELLAMRYDLGGDDLSDDVVSELFSILEEDAEEGMDDVFGDEWRNLEKQNISRIYNESNDYLNATLKVVHDEMITEINDLFETKNKDSIEGAVLLIRAILLFERYFSRIAAATDSSSSQAIKPTTSHEISAHDLLIKIYSNLAGLLADSIEEINPKYYKHADIGLWSSYNANSSSPEDEEKKEIKNDENLLIWPDVPSLAILNYLHILVRNLLEILGSDNVVWEPEAGISIVREKVGKYILNQLEEHVYNTVSEFYQGKIEKAAESEDIKEDIAISEDNKEEDKKEDTTLSEDQKEDDEQETETAQVEEKDEDKSDESKDITDNASSSESDQNESSKQQQDNSLHLLQTSRKHAFLQIFADYIYISELLGLSSPTSNGNNKLTKSLENEHLLDEEIKDQIITNIKQQIIKTRVLYLPFSV